VAGTAGGPGGSITSSWSIVESTDLAAVSTALRAAASHDSELTPSTSVTRYTLSAMADPPLLGTVSAESYLPPLVSSARTP
jgi:hypothetical protein